MLRTCAACGTRYAPDLDACPNCWSEDYEEGDDMPKITTAGGASFPPGPETPAPAPETAPAEPAAAAAADPPAPAPAPAPAPRAPRPKGAASG